MDNVVMLEILEYNAKRWWNRILKFYPSAGTMPKLRISNRLGVNRKPGRPVTLALAYYDDREIVMSAKGMAMYQDLYPDNVIPHELAHIVAFEVYGDHAHGKGWKTVIQSCGIKTSVTLDI